ncbi:hypothetical protein [Geobacillus vulcani]|uniref:hypothetical protein n=1 Tax=Geobacillus vulcani TaxID=135517 RepID=UPI0004DED960|nr:hypothetical protein [Geobacillus vulcani]
MNMTGSHDRSTMIGFSMFDMNVACLEDRQQWPAVIRGKLLSWKAGEKQLFPLIDEGTCEKQD